jgi:hypothetical protein
MNVRKEYTTEYGGYNKAQIQLDHDSAKGHNAVAVWYDGGPHPFMSSLNTGQIYIRGHGMPGYISIETARGGERLHYTEVVQRLIVSGLKREFSGQIKCYNCHSAEPGVVPKNNVDAQLGKDPFAQLVADELYARGFKLCTFFGYIGAIDSHVKDGSAGKHKYVRGPGGAGEFGRASESRVQFYPRVHRTKNPLALLMKKLLK